MTDKEVQKLGRKELIEILYYLRQDIDYPYLMQNSEPLARTF